MPGVKQKLKRWEEEDAATTGAAPPESRESRLVRSALWFFFWGYWSGSHVRETLKSAFDDGLKHPSVVRLAKVAATAKHVRNSSFTCNNFTLLRITNATRIPLL